MWDEDPTFFSTKTPAIITVICIPSLSNNSLCWMRTNFLRTYAYPASTVCQWSVPSFKSYQHNPLIAERFSLNLSEYWQKRLSRRRNVCNVSSLTNVLGVMSIHFLQRSISIQAFISKKKFTFLWRANFSYIVARPLPRKSIPSFQFGCFPSER